MRIAVSPYHLTTKEPAAAAAFLLGESVVTMLPAPFNGDRQHAEALSTRIPKYLDFIQSWRWTVPLWNAGVVASAVGGQDAVEDVRAVCARIASDERFGPLRPLMKPELFDTEEGYLEAVARDLLKAGPDPAITVPVAAGMDRFSMRCGLVPARSDPTSVVQRAEERLGKRAFAVGLPVLLQASGERLLRAREALDPELADLREALAAFADEGVEMTPDELLAAQGDLAVAARGYASAFDTARDELVAPQEEDEDIRPIAGTVALTGLILPGDAVLTSSISAMRTLSPAMARVAAGPTTKLPVRVDPLEGRQFLTLVFRPLGRPGRRR
jgi:hypothetical protein